MTKKDYKLIAGVILHSRIAYFERIRLINDFADVLKADNPSFDETKFAIACGEVG